MLMLPLTEAEALCQASLLSLRHTIDVLRDRLAVMTVRFQMADRERRQFMNSSMRYAYAKLPATIERIRQEQMDAILQHTGSAQITPAEERCEVLLEALQVLIEEKNRGLSAT